MSGTTLDVRVSPKASRNALLGWHGTALKLAVTAAPERGKANTAVLRLLADALALPPAAVKLLSGAGSRDKRVSIDGLDAGELRRRLDALLG